MHDTPVRFAALLLVATACSNGSGGAAGDLQLDDRTIHLSFRDIIASRVHDAMWRETVYEALTAPTRDLTMTPPPDDPCISVVSVQGSVAGGFVWKVAATDCVDLAGVTRTMNGEITFVGAPEEDGRFTGSYAGTFDIFWAADPDGGRAAEAAKLNAEAPALTFDGSWEIDALLIGVVQGTVVFSTGAVGVRDLIE